MAFYVKKIKLKKFFNVFELRLPNYLNCRLCLVIGTQQLIN